MKVELILSKTYIHAGKCYNKGFTYQVSDALGGHLLEQTTERGVPYFRQAHDGKVPAYEPAAKSVSKGGQPQEAVDEVEEEEVEEKPKKKKKKKSTGDWRALQKQGKELGVYEQGMSKDELKAAIEEAEAAGEDDSEDSDPVMV